MTVEQPPSDVDLHPEHLAALDACQRPLSVAELASELDLPLGVIRVLLGDLLERGLVMVREPAKDLKLPDQRLLEAVMDGLQAL
jgi:DNA-binding IclR family transcriptional regulator